MSALPTLTTSRLLLRPFRFEDARAVQRLAGERDVAATTLNIPHPYEDGMAEAWIATHEEDLHRGRALTLAIVLKESGTLIGAICLHLDHRNFLGELGYWVGKPYWNLGYCTEAATAMVAYAFRTLGLNRVQARHFASNPASGRVMKKIGMRYEGTLRQALFHWGRFEDTAIYAILREEWQSEVHESRGSEARFGSAADRPEAERV